MPVEAAFTYMVHPGRLQPDPGRLTGAAVPLEGKLFELLSDIYNKSERECDTDIAFNASRDGRRQNHVRDMVVAFVSDPNLDRGRAIAHRLEQFTTHRSGLGLLFLITGREAGVHKLVISRFPADSAILAEENQRTLSVEFLEKVFMKSAHSYKAALFKHSSLDAGFWLGQAIDKQTSNPAVRVSNYWVAEFLDADFRTTSAAGSRRLAVALRDAMKATDDVAIKSEIAAAVTLANGLNGTSLSPEEFQDRFGLSGAAREAIVRALQSPAVAAERFVFDSEEFSRHVAIRSVHLDTGVVISAPVNQFDNLVHYEPSTAQPGRGKFAVEGEVVDEKLLKISGR